MVSLASLWLPIVLSSVAVFIVSSIVHMVLPYHKSDCKQIPDEEALRAALHASPPSPGYFMVPFSDMKSMKSPAMQQKFNEGPVMNIIVRPNGFPNMGKYLGMWFAYCVVIGVFVAYLTGHTVMAGATFRAVLRVAGTAAFMSYGLGVLANGIWKGHPWSMTIKETFDGLIYALVTGATFAWLWPH